METATLARSSCLPRRLAALAMALLVAAAPACSRDHGDTAKGETLFKERCGVCHPTGNEGAQGPGLGGVLGRKAASTRFPYSPGLRASGLIWDVPNLDRYLAAPGEMVPATLMAVATPDPTERRNVIAYLSTLRAPATPPATARPVQSGVQSDATIPVAAPGLRTGVVALGDFRTDGPGVRRHLTVADLPAPFATQSMRNSPSVAERPAGAELHVPPGFRVELFARDLEAPRLVRVAPNGDVFVVESAAGRIRVLRARDGAPAPDRVEIFAKDLERPFGIAFYPPGSDPTFLYVANTNGVVRFPYHAGDLVTHASAETIVAKLAPTNGGHWTRDVAFSPDGKRMFVSVGSASNVAEGMPSRSAADIHDWETAHGLGAAWGDEERRADVMVFDPDGKGGRTFATGIRNCVGLAVHPATGDLWCSTNERDGLGDNLVPDYVTRVREGAFYGWPWYYLGDHEEPRQAGSRPDLRGRITVPDVLLQPHSASLQLTFYDGAMFPASFRGNVFAAFHGSWNRKSRTGYKVVRVLVENGVPTGEYEDFLTGFVVDDDHVWARPVGVAVAHDGALLVSEDGNGTIWRVSYQGEARP